MTETIMSADDFSIALKAYQQALKGTIAAPLDDMLAYIEHAEKLADKAGELDSESASHLRFMARMLSASIFLRSTAQLGGGAIG